MQELAIAAGLGAGLVVLAIVPGPWAILGGLGLTGTALLVGLGAGAMYHLALHGALRSDLPAGWIWNPTAHHGRLDAEAAARVMPWFYAGAAGFLGCIAGAALLVSGLLKSA